MLNNPCVCFFSIFCCPNPHVSRRFFRSSEAISPCGPPQLVRALPQHQDAVVAVGGPDQLPNYYIYINKWLING